VRPKREEAFVTDEVAPTEEEQEQVPDRLEEEDAMRGAGHEDPELPAESPPSEPIHEALGP